MSKKRGKLFIIGALLGFIAGLFLAPKKGSELRREAKDKFEEVKENPKEVLQETLESVKDKVSNIIDNNISDDEEIQISEEEIVISKTFNDEGESK
ncbi:YtxH domain-containing protein [Romboutsia sp.]|uniref:YtxH domain-containing protein n=1 Tax=Romboutsia sp. TaxID=1965302 RepID=UPI003F357730